MRCWRRIPSQTGHIHDCKMLTTPSATRRHCALCTHEGLPCKYEISRSYKVYLAREVFKSKTEQNVLLYSYSYATELKQTLKSTAHKPMAFNSIFDSQTKISRVSVQNVDSSHCMDPTNSNCNALDWHIVRKRLGKQKQGHNTRRTRWRNFIVGIMAA